MMPIRKLKIIQFRGLHNQEINCAGKRLNAIIGQNGSMKTTILGIIASSFSLKSSLMKDSKTIDDAEFGIDLTSRFKFSPIYDLAGSHEWSIDMSKAIYADTYRMKSYSRPNGKLRFWKVGSRKKGDSLVQCPVLYLSMSRLSPLGEENRVSIGTSGLTDEEKALFRNWHNDILISTDLISNSGLVKSSKKSTLAPETNYYDEYEISAGQDNIGKIILAVLSMKRLKENYPNDYKGSIICIDEVESTLYPASQERILTFLNKVSDDYDIQFFFTTHSMTIVRSLFSDDLQKFVSITYAKKIGQNVELHQDVSLQQIEDDLYIKRSFKRPVEKIRVYCEDSIGMEFTKCLIGKKYTQSKDLSYENRDDSGIGWSNYLYLLEHKIPEFLTNIIVLDGDVKENVKDFNKLKKYKNVVFLPTDDYPEKRVYDCLRQLDDNDQFWDNGIGDKYSKQKCFADFMDENLNEAQIKRWFKDQKNQYGRGFTKIIVKSFEDHMDEKNDFVKSFSKAFEYVKQNRL